MRSLNAEQLELIRDVSAEGHTRLPPAALEKDVHLTDVLSVLANVDWADFEAVLGGGTSLSKTSNIIERMSEDIDIKIVREVRSWTNADRRNSAQIRERIKEGLMAAHYQVEALPSDNRNRMHRFNVTYASGFPTSVALRPDIKLEVMVDALVLPRTTRAVQTHLYTVIQRTYTSCEWRVVAEAETMAEKVLSLLRRWRAEDFEFSVQADPELARHVYDVHQISLIQPPTSDVARAFRFAFQKDWDRYEADRCTSQKDFLDSLKRSVQLLGSQPVAEAAYAKFVDELAMGVDPTFSEACGTFTAWAELLLESTPRDGGCDETA